MSVLDRMRVQGRDDIAGGLVAENGETTLERGVVGLEPPTKRLCAP